MGIHPASRKEVADSGEETSVPALFLLNSIFLILRGLIRPGR